MKKARLDALRGAVARAECDAFVSLDASDNQYLTGFVDNLCLAGLSETTSSVIVTESRALFLCDFRYTEHAQREVRGFEIREMKGNLAQRTSECLREMGAANVAFDPGRHTVDEVDNFGKAFDGMLVRVPGVVTGLRVVKDEAEVERIRSAMALAEGVLADLLPSLSPGIREQELAARFEYEFKKRGAAGASFPTIALFGPLSSLPHGEPGHKALEPGDVVLIDFGCRVNGYCSDLTRTYAYGTIPGAWYEGIYEITLTAQKLALETVRAGLTGREVDAAARNLIAEAGYGTHFGHGLGHGVGIEIHEAPRLNPESDVVLQEGMVVTIEPGIYLPGRGGVRIEDLVVVTASGCEVLSRTPKELRVLGI